jgi:hypothetical protein
MTVRIAMPITMRKQNPRKRPSLLALLPMFGEQREIFEVPDYKGKKKNRGNGRSRPPSAASLHLYSRICEVGI